MRTLPTRPPSPKPSGAWCKNGVLHPMNDFFVRRTNRGQNAAEVGAGGIDRAMDEVIRTQANAGGINELRFMEALQDVGRLGGAGERFVHGGGPLGLGKITAQVNAAGAPCI